jgi:hypothetical protein
VNVSGSKYVNVPANKISSWYTSSRGTIFIWGADTEQSKVHLWTKYSSATSADFHRAMWLYIAEDRTLQGDEWLGPVKAENFLASWMQAPCIGDGSLFTSHFLFLIWTKCSLNFTGSSERLNHVYPYRIQTWLVPTAWSSQPPAGAWREYSGRWQTGATALLSPFQLQYDGHPVLRRIFAHKTTSFPTTSRSWYINTRIMFLDIIHSPTLI